VLDSFDTNLVTAPGFLTISGATTSGGLPDAGGTVTTDSITGRRDLAYFKEATISTDSVTVDVRGGQYTFSSAAAQNGFAYIQNDYGLSYGLGSSQTLLAELDLTGASIIGAGKSAYIIDLDSTSDAGFEVQFTVWGNNAADFATSAVQTTAGGVEELRFDLDDFTDKNGLFATNVLAGKTQFTWSDVYGYTISVSSGSGVFTGDFVANEVFATIPEPGSMLAMAGLFGGAGLVGFRRKRALKKAIKA
jgi:hypothetical protein